MNNADNFTNSSSHGTQSNVNAVDAELLNDFFKEITEIYQKSTTSVKQLDQLCLNITAKNNSSTSITTEINTLFRGVHTLKSSLHLVGLTELSVTAHSLEDVLSALRANTFSYNKNIGQILLITLERLSLAAREIIYADPAHLNHDLSNIATKFYFHSLAAQISKICNTIPDERENAINKTLDILTVDDDLSNTINNYGTNNTSILTAAVLYQSTNKWQKIFNDIAGLLNHTSTTTQTISAKHLLQVIMATHRQAETIFSLSWLDKFNALMQHIHINRN